MTIPMRARQPMMAHEPSKLRVIQLPIPKDECNTSVFTALARRRTTREISSTPLSIQELSNVLWAACGINRATGRGGVACRTAASATNSHEIDVYVAVESGVYLFDAIHHRLEAIVLKDLRAGALTPGQRGVNTKAPVQLIFVADLERLTHASEFIGNSRLDADVQQSYYYVDTGLIAGNVYLLAAAQGLAAWFHSCHRTDLARRLGLRPEQRVLFAQSIGRPEES